MRQARASSPASQRGIGALVVVMSLFFIMSMVAAYASRTLIFEQRTSANNYRSTQAFEAAEAGLEWAIAMLNGGRVDEQCVGTTDPTLDTFRDRHLSIDTNDRTLSLRKWVNAGAQADLHPTCARGEDEDGVVRWMCSCRANADPELAAPAGAVPTPTFRISFEAVEDQPGLLRIRSEGCSSFGTPCFAGAGVRSDAVAEVNALVGLAPSVTQMPTAALTLRGSLDAADANVSNDQGVVINAGGDEVIAPNAKGPPGSPPLVSKSDPSLQGPNYSGSAHAGGLSRGQVMFLAAFGMPPAFYRTQPAVVRMTCADPCAQKLVDAAAQYPGRVIWIDGDLVIEDDAPPFTIGSVAAPVVVVVSGDMSFGSGSNVTINGLVYSRGARWVATGSTALVNGAFVAEGLSDPSADGSFTITGSPAIVFDPQVVDHLKKAQQRRVMDFGSIVRVPGSWRDFGQ